MQLAQYSNWSLLSAFQFLRLNRHFSYGLSYLRRYNAALFFEPEPPLVRGIILPALWGIFSIPARHGIMSRILLKDIQFLLQPYQ